MVVAEVHRRKADGELATHLQTSAFTLLLLAYLWPTLLAQGVLVDIVANLHGLRRGDWARPIPGGGGRCLSGSETDSPGLPGIGVHLGHGSRADYPADAGPTLRRELHNADNVANFARIVWALLPRLGGGTGLQLKPRAHVAWRALASHLASMLRSAKVCGRVIYLEYHVDGGGHDASEESHPQSQREG